MFNHICKNHSFHAARGSLITFELNNYQVKIIIFKLLILYKWSCVGLKYLISHNTLLMMHKDQIRQMQLDKKWVVSEDEKCRYLIASLCAHLLAMIRRKRLDHTFSVINYTHKRLIRNQKVFFTLLCRHHFLQLLHWLIVQWV